VGRIYEASDQYTLLFVTSVILDYFSFCFIVPHFLVIRHEYIYVTSSVCIFQATSSPMSYRVFVFSFITSFSNEIGTHPSETASGLSFLTLLELQIRLRHIHKF
jgi:hypothetical protein